jgi:hypothetical protein
MISPTSPMAMAWTLANLEHSDGLSAFIADRPLLLLGRLHRRDRRSEAALRIPASSLSYADLLWLSLMFAPLGWWALDTRARALGLVPMLALLFVPLFTPLLVTPVSQYTAAIAGMAAATLLRWGARRPRHA